MTTRLSPECRKSIDRAHAHLDAACREWLPTGFSLVALIEFLFVVYLRASQRSVNSRETKECEHWGDIREAMLKYPIPEDERDMILRPKRRTPKLRAPSRGT